MIEKKIIFKNTILFDNTLLKDPNCLKYFLDHLWNIKMYKKLQKKSGTIYPEESRHLSFVLRDKAACSLMHAITHSLKSKEINHDEAIKALDICIKHHFFSQHEGKLAWCVGFFKATSPVEKLIKFRQKLSSVNETPHYFFNG